MRLYHCESASHNPFDQDTLEKKNRMCFLLIFILFFPLRPYPTGRFTILEHQIPSIDELSGTRRTISQSRSFEDPSHDVPEQHKICQSPDLEALKFRKSSSGICTSKMSILGFEALKLRMCQLGTGRRLACSTQLMLLLITKFGLFDQAFIIFE